MEAVGEMKPMAAAGAGAPPETNAVLVAVQLALPLGSLTRVRPAPALSEMRRPLVRMLPTTSRAASGVSVPMPRLPEK